MPDKRLGIFSEKDSLAVFINEKANELFLLLQNINPASLQLLDEPYKSYFINYHLDKRLIFSIQSSAYILYYSIKRSGKNIDELSIVDYGAGLGTLFMLAAMLGFKRVVYNDYLPEWKNAAETICNIYQLPINDYVAGEMEDVISLAKSKGFTVDIIVSRNVIEHIYNLPNFYKKIHEHNPKAIVYSTTSADYHNPAVFLKHYFLHKKYERIAYAPQRKKKIKELYPSLNEEQVGKIVLQTRGMAREDFYNAVNALVQNKPVEKVKFLRSNTCDCETGYWCENLLSKKEYASIIQSAGFKFEYLGGFYDTNYSYTALNIVAKILNRLMKLVGKKGYILAPFVSVEAYN